MSIVEESLEKIAALSFVFTVRFISPWCMNLTDATAIKESLQLFIIIMIIFTELNVVFINLFFSNRQSFLRNAHILKLKT